MAIASSCDLKSIPCGSPVGNDAGSAYFVPNPEDQGYAVVVGLPPLERAMSLPEDEKSTPVPATAGNVAGFEYLVPNPKDQGYAETKGEVS
jgi:hypothetical protein